MGVQKATTIGSRAFFVGLRTGVLYLIANLFVIISAKLPNIELVHLHAGQMNLSGQTFSTFQTFLKLNIRTGFKEKYLTQTNLVCYKVACITIYYTIIFANTRN